MYLSYFTWRPFQKSLFILELSVWDVIIGHWLFIEGWLFIFLGILVCFDQHHRMCQKLQELLLC